MFLLFKLEVYLQSYKIINRVSHKDKKNVQNAAFQFEKRSENQEKVVKFEVLSFRCSEKPSKSCLAFSYSFIYSGLEKTSPPFKSFETETDLRKS